jgi:hypothetical protein
MSTASPKQVDDMLTVDKSTVGAPAFCASSIILLGAAVLGDIAINGKE